MTDGSKVQLRPVRLKVCRWNDWGRIKDDWSFNLYLRKILADSSWNQQHEALYDCRLLNEFMYHLFRRNKMNRYLLDKIRKQKHPDREMLQIYSKFLVVKNGLHSFHLLHPSIVYVQLHYSLVRWLHTHTHTHTHTHFLWHCRTSTHVQLWSRIQTD